MKKTSRLLYLITLIMCNPGLSVKRLADKSGVSERTIYRDILDISEANFPIYYDRGYRILDTARKLPLTLSGDETFFLYNALQSVPKTGFFKNIAARLNDKLKHHIPDFYQSESLEYHTNSTDKPIDVNLFKTLNDCIDSNHKISVNYTSLNGKTSERIVRPYGAAYKEHGWYMVGLCENRNEIRIFRIVRIKSLAVLDEKFSKPADFSITRFLEESWGIYRGEIYDFKVKFTGPAAVSIKSTKHHKDEVVTPSGKNAVIYEVRTRGKKQFFDWIFIYGTNAELLEPVELRHEYRQHLVEVLKKYEGGTK